MKLWKLLPLLVLPFALAACAPGAEEGDDETPAASQNREDDDD